jgi:hypothetical protein
MDPDWIRFQDGQIWPPKRELNEEMSYLKSLNVLKTYMTVFDEKNFKILIVKNFVILNLGLDPDPDWILDPYSATGWIRMQ